MSVFLIGRGREVWLYLVCWLLALTLWSIHTYFRDSKPGAGPDGGEAIFTLLVVISPVWIAIGGVNTFRLASRRRLNLFQRAFVAPPIGAGVMIGAFALVLAYPPASAAGYVVMAALFIGRNLIAMAAVRNFGRAAGKRLRGDGALALKPLTQPPPCVPRGSSSAVGCACRTAPCR